MEYNSQREKLTIPEYGRHIQKMVQTVLAEKDKEVRNKQAKAIIDVMGQLNPHLRDVADFKHKLWDHLFVISDFKLDVDSPFPKPTQESLSVKPKKLAYPGRKIKYKHYGRTNEIMIEKAIEFPEGPEKEALIMTIANHLKKSYVTWNKDTVDDDKIIGDLLSLSDGKLKLDPKTVLTDTTEILAANKRKKRNTRSNNNHKSRNNSRRRGGY
ncbi:MAG: hypothetical protein COB85_01530 [Bacteroidetes bacterium]|nr:MAG: hypothetical protein COB85_01530 [Bacteroidota bacterium]